MASIHCEDTEKKVRSKPVTGQTVWSKYIRDIPGNVISDRNNLTKKYLHLVSRCSEGCPTYLVLHVEDYLAWLDTATGGILKKVM